MSGHRYGDAQITGGRVLLGNSTVTNHINTAIFSDNIAAIDIGLHLAQISESTSALISTATDLKKLLLHVNQTTGSRPLTLSAINTQCNVVSLSLRLLQNYVGQRSSEALLQAEGVWEETEMSIASCAHTFAMVKQALLPLLTEQTGRRADGANQDFEAVLSQSHLKELLGLLRGQQVALHLLLSLWQSQSLMEIHDILQPHKFVMRTLTRKTTRSSVSSLKKRATDTEIPPLPDTLPPNVSTLDRELLASDVYQRGSENLRKLEVGDANQSVSAILAHYLDDADETATSSKSESKRSSQVDMASDPGRAILAAIEWAADSERDTLSAAPHQISPPRQSSNNATDTIFDQDEGPESMNLAVLEKALSDPVSSTQRASIPSGLKERSQSIWSTRSDPSKAVPKLKTVWIGEPDIGITDTIFQILNGRPRAKSERASMKGSSTTTATFSGSKLKVELLSTSGMAESDRLMDQPYDHADCIVYGFRISSPPSFDAILQKWVPEVKRSSDEIPSILVGYGSEERAAILLMGAKPARSSSFVSHREGQNLCKKIEATEYLECATRDSASINALWEAVVQTAIVGKYGSDSASTKSSRSFRWPFFNKSR